MQGGRSRWAGAAPNGHRDARRPTTAQPAASSKLSIMPGALPQTVDSTEVCTDALDDGPVRGEGAGVPSGASGLADGQGSADVDAAASERPATLSAQCLSTAEAEPVLSSEPEPVPSGAAAGRDSGTPGMGSGALREEDEAAVDDKDSSDEDDVAEDDDIANEDIAAAISAAEMDAEARAAAVDSGAVVMLAEEAGAGTEAEQEGLDGSMLTSGRRSSGPVAKAAAGTLDAFLPQTDATGA